MPRAVHPTRSLPAHALARRLASWFRLSQRPLPWRGTRDPYRIWVSEVMLQQTTVKAVEPYFERFVTRFSTLDRLARAPLDRVLATWSGLGYYRRARHLHAAARLMMRRHGGRLPDRREDLLALPGIGPYTAGAILSIAYGRKEPLVDGNVARVLSRLLLLRGDPRAPAAQAALWAAARTLVEASQAPGDLNQALMELGATVCTPARPACPRCPVAKLCAARGAGLQEAVPGRRPAARTLRLRQIVALVRRDGRMLVRRRGRTGLMDGLWELPAVDAAGRAPGGDRLQVALGRRLAKLSHSITFRRIEVEVCEARLLLLPRGPGYRWVDPAAARRLPASSLLPKILDRLGDAGWPTRTTVGRSGYHGAPGTRAGVDRAARRKGVSRDAKIPDRDSPRSRNGRVRQGREGPPHHRLPFRDSRGLGMHGRGSQGLDHRGGGQQG